MRTGILFLVSAVMISATVQANDIPSLETRLADIERSCFERDWESVQCEFAEVGHQSPELGVYQRIPVVDNLATILYSAIRRFGIDSAIYYARRFAAEFGITADDVAIQKRVNFVKLQLEAAQVAKDKKLAACKRACLANCISAHSMKYVDGSNFRSLVPADSLARGYGLCQHYSTMASFLSHALGNPNTLAVGSYPMKHYFVATELDGRWWYSEPQSDRCQFFQVKHFEIPGLKK